MTRSERQVEGWGEAIGRAHFGSGTFRDVAIYSARGGEDCDHAAQRMVLQSSGLDIPVLCSFNNTPMLAMPGDRWPDVAAQWLRWRGDA